MLRLAGVRSASAARARSSPASSKSIHMLSQSARNSSLSMVARHRHSPSDRRSTPVGHPSDRQSTHKTTPPRGTVDHAVDDPPQLLDALGEFGTLFRRYNLLGEQFADLSCKPIRAIPFDLGLPPFSAGPLSVRPLALAVSPVAVLSRQGLC